MTDEGATIRKRAARARLRTYTPEPTQDRGWRDEAACRTLDPDLFFPTDGGSAAGEVLAAKAVCADCPVRMQCLDYAYATYQHHGIWGGLTEMERRANQRRRRFR